MILWRKSKCHPKKYMAAQALHVQDLENNSDFIHSQVFLFDSCEMNGVGDF